MPQDSQGGDGFAELHTLPPLEPMVRSLVDAYNQASGAGVEPAIGSQSEVVYAVSTGDGQGPGSLAQFLQSGPAKQILAMHGYLP
jgi:hypothetical protein